MKQYNSDDFHNNDAWLIFRVDAILKEQPIDIYILMDLPSEYIMAHELVLSELSQKLADKLLKEGKTKKGITPQRLLLTTGDPAESCLRKSAEKLSMNLELVPSQYIDELVAPVKQSFGEHFFSPSSVGYTNHNDGTDDSDREDAKQMIPDSYDPCSCASGKKYKFCCKKIFCEIVEAMVSAEEGRISEALEWIAKAKTVVGEAAEVLCREAIVYSYFDPEKSEEILLKCLATNPNHPRAYYIRGLTLKQQGDFQGAIKAYETAIKNYPPSDQYHLNEAYNNLGTVFHSLGDYPKAKSAWEQALLYLPSDKMARQNLTEFIYGNPRSGSR